jgi:hypothetical protein
MGHFFRDKGRVNFDIKMGSAKFWAIFFSPTHPVTLFAMRSSSIERHERAAAAHSTKFAFKAKRIAPYSETRNNLRPG